MIRKSLLTLIMAAGSAKNEGTITIAERNCNYYSISVGFANFVQSYQYAFDEETGICLLMATTEQREMMYHKIREYRTGLFLFIKNFRNTLKYKQF